jgi:hypothetical protein
MLLCAELFNLHERQQKAKRAREDERRRKARKEQAEKDKDNDVSTPAAANTNANATANANANALEVVDPEKEKEKDKEPKEGSDVRIVPMQLSDLVLTEDGMEPLPSHIPSLSLPYPGSADIALTIAYSLLDGSRDGCHTDPPLTDLSQVHTVGVLASILRVKDGESGGVVVTLNPISRIQLTGIAQRFPFGVQGRVLHRPDRDYSLAHYAQQLDEKERNEMIALGTYAPRIHRTHCLRRPC